MPQEPSSESSKPLEEIRREVVEARNMTIKTDNALKSLHAELKVVSSQQADFQRRTWFATGAAYLGFLAVCVGGAIAVSGARASSANEQRQRLEQQVAELTAQLDKQKSEAQAVEKAERAAADVYRQMTTLAGEERLKGVEALAKLDTSKLTPLTRQALQDRATLLRKEVGASVLERGKTAFRRGDWPEAVEQLTRFLAMNPVEEDALDASFFLGNSLFQSRKYEEAIKPLTRFVEGDKKARTRDFALVMLVQSHDVVGNKDKAIEYAKEGWQTYPASEFRNQFIGRLQRSMATPAAAPPATAPAAPAPAAPPTPPAQGR
ncbi:MAG: tetratricopeptide repeat protein [Myxococcaceae bacterium]|nr:tetratricopeptide repeat protein [Myxococcaceae bacterium]